MTLGTALAEALAALSAWRGELALPCNDQGVDVVRLQLTSSHVDGLLGVERSVVVGSEAEDVQRLLDIGYEHEGWGKV